MAEAGADDDVALVRRCLTGDAAAVREFVDRFQQAVLSICWRMLGQREDAEDVSQEVFFRAFRHLARWDQQRPLRPWVLAIAANRCRTRLASRRPEFAGGEQLAETTAANDRSTPDLAEELQQGVLRLRDEYRMCFILFYQQELSIQEVAEALDCPAGTVKTWLFRARKELADYLRQRGVVTEAGDELHEAR